MNDDLMLADKIKFVWEELQGMKKADSFNGTNFSKEVEIELASLIQHSIVLN